MNEISTIPKKKKKNTQRHPSHLLAGEDMVKRQLYMKQEVGPS